MTHFRKRPVVVEAITFDELVAYGKENGANIVDGMPWSFFYHGHPVTHETDDCYLIPTLEGTMRMGRGDMLITGVKGEIYPCKSDAFAATYDRHVDDQPERLAVLADELAAVCEALSADAADYRLALLEIWRGGAAVPEQVRGIVERALAEAEQDRRTDARVQARLRELGLLSSEEDAVGS